MEASRKKQKRLVFDRRYGWVFDEWKNPSEEALSGGRGMFCIVPLAKGFLKMASNSINAAASSVIKVIERPELLSPWQLQASLGDQLSNIMIRLKQPKMKSLSRIIDSFGSGMDLRAERSTSPESKCS